MLDLKISVSAGCLQQPLKKSLPTIAELGARGAQIDALGGVRLSEMSRAALRQIRHLLDDLNLTATPVLFLTRRGYNTLEDLDRRVEGTKDAMRLARELGTGFVINHIGHVPEDESSIQWQTLTAVLSDLGTASLRLGAMLLAKTGSESGPQLAKILAALPEGSLGVDLDPGRLIVHGHSPSEAAAVLGPHIHHVTANDGVRDLSQGRGQQVQLGRGSVDYAELLGLLEEHDYRGWLTVDRHGAADPRSEITDAISYLKSMYD